MENGVVMGSGIGISFIGNVAFGQQGSSLDSFESSALQFDLEQGLSSIDLQRAIAVSGGRADPGPDVADQTADNLFAKYGQDSQMRDAISEILQPYLNGDMNNTNTQLANSWFSKLEDTGLSSGSFGSGSNLIFS